LLGAIDPFYPLVQCPFWHLIPINTSSSCLKTLKSRKDFYAGANAREREGSIRLLNPERTPSR
jgi:hypothetical protein